MTRDTYNVAKRLAVELSLPLPVLSTVFPTGDRTLISCEANALPLSHRDGASFIVTIGNWVILCQFIGFLNGLPLKLIFVINSMLNACFKTTINRT